MYQRCELRIILSTDMEVYISTVFKITAYFNDRLRIIDPFPSTEVMQAVYR